jgi:predicted nucleotidyltransferase component of viral defense system
MNSPIESLIRNESQLKIAALQDEVTRIIFDTVAATMHGGTAIWRCYSGSRFSEDIDLYMDKDTYLKKAVNRLALSGLRIRFNRRRNGTVYHDVFEGTTKISLQTRISKKKGILAMYERIDGVKMDIYSLSPENLIKEKIDTYTDRRLIRDVYDIMVLTRSVTDKAKVAGVLGDFLLKINKPNDENILKELIYTGVIPSFDEIVIYLKRWCGS